MSRLEGARAMLRPVRGIILLFGLACTVAAATAEEATLPGAKPVPDVQVIPLPYNQASFQHQGRELTRHHFSLWTKRPFLYPLIGPAGRSLTRMGHPHDPAGHGHHNSVWISHHDVGEVDFWSDNVDSPGGGSPIIMCDQVLQYEDGPKQAWMLTANTWRTRLWGDVLMRDRRRICVEPLEGDDWLMMIDLRLEAGPPVPVQLGQTPFGIIGVRMAKTIGVHDGGGRILNSEGQVNEEQVFRKPARWVDYSGRVTNKATGGITLMDHPVNPEHPTPFHVRNDGWMGACLTLNRSFLIQPDRPLRLRYGLWIHAGVPTAEQVEERWKDFKGRELPTMERVRR